MLMLISPFLISFLSILYSDNIREGWRILEKTIPILILPLALSSTSQFTRNELQRLLNLSIVIFVLSCFVYLGYATIRYFSTGDYTVFFWKNLTDPFSFHPTYLSLVLTVLIAAILLRLYRGVPYPIWIVHVFILIVFFVTLLLLGSKLLVIILSVLLVLFVVGYISTRKFQPHMVAVIIVVVAGLIAVCMHPTVRERFSHITRWTYRIDAPAEEFNELTIRFALAQCAWEIIQNEPLLGVGIGDVDEELLKVYYRLDYKFGYLDRQNPHNQFLSTLLSTGLVGLAVLLTIFVVGVRSALKNKSWVYLSFLTIFFLTLFVESMLERQKGIVVFSLVNSIYFFHLHRHSEQIRSKDI